MITKKFGIDLISYGGALTRQKSEVTDDNNEIYGVLFTKTHPDGWTIIGRVSSDYYEWVNEFEAFHPNYGKVWGDFEIEVFAESEEGFNHFYKNHTPEDWDYQDI